MDPRAARRLVIPTALAVTTLLACRVESQDPYPYCVDIVKKAECDQAEHCGWSEALSECVNTCHTHKDQAACEAIEQCEWSPGFGGSDTGEGDTSATGGGGADCHEPFT